MDYPLAKQTYKLTSGFGMRWGSMHRGLDFSAPLKTPIYAAENGTAVDVRGGNKADEPGYVSGFGCWIVLDHVINGKKVSTVYGHMYKEDLFVQKGEKVVKGQLIALVGNNGQSTGPHLHFEVWVGGRLSGGEAVDPVEWLDNEAPVDYDGWCCGGNKGTVA